MSETHAPTRSVMTMARSWLALRDSIAVTDPRMDTEQNVTLVRGNERDTATDSRLSSVLRDIYHRPRTEKWVMSEDAVYGCYNLASTKSYVKSQRGNLCLDVLYISCTSLHRQKIQTDVQLTADDEDDDSLHCLGPKKQHHAGNIRSLAGSVLHVCCSRFSTLLGHSDYSMDGPNSRSPSWN